MSTERPSSADSAVPAVPEPMLASSRSASSCRSVNWRAHGAGPFAGVRRRGRGRGRVARRVGERVAVDDQGDLAVGEHGAAGERGAARPTSAGSGRVTSSRWPTRRVDGERDAASRRPGTMTRVVAVAASARGRAARRRRRAAARRRAGRACAAPATERTGWSARRDACARRGRAGWRTARSSTSTSSAAMIASVSGRRIWAVVPAPGSECSRTSPPSSRTVGRTASMPTPRPEMSLV